MARSRGLVALVLLVLSGSAAASPMRGGIRLGITEDPDTIFVGGFGVVDDLGGVPKLALEPGGDVGIGDEDFFGNQYRVPVGSGEMTAFPLAGVSVYYLNLDGCPDGFDCDDTDVGINFGGGFELNRRFGIQLWITADNPDITLAGTLAF
jgi:hypothetical protein